MSTNLSSGLEAPRSRSRVHCDRLADDEAICDELSDGLTRVGIADLVGFVWVEPDLAFPTANDRGREPFLSSEVHPAFQNVSSNCKIHNNTRANCYHRGLRAVER